MHRMFCRANRAESIMPFDSASPGQAKSLCALIVHGGGGSRSCLLGAGRQHVRVCITRGLSQRRRTCLPASGHLQSLPQDSDTAQLCNGQACLLATRLLTSPCSKKQRRGETLRGRGTSVPWRHRAQHTQAPADGRQVVHSAWCMVHGTKVPRGPEDQDGLGWHARWQLDGSSLSPGSIGGVGPGYLMTHG